MAARIEAELPLGAMMQRNSKPDQSAGGAGRVGPAFARAVSPPGKPSRAKEANPRRAAEYQDAKAFGPKRSSVGKQDISRDVATNEAVRILGSTLVGSDA